MLGHTQSAHCIHPSGFVSQSKCHFPSLILLFTRMTLVKSLNKSEHHPRPLRYDQCPESSPPPHPSYISSSSSQCSILLLLRSRLPQWFPHPSEMQIWPWSFSVSTSPTTPNALKNKIKDFFKKLIYSLYVPECFACICVSVYRMHAW